VVNPACIKAFAKTNLSRNKTDSADALLIANYANKCDPKLFISKKPILKEIQEIHRWLCPIDCVCAKVRYISLAGESPAVEGVASSII